MPGEVEETQQIPVADVEEEVARALVVAVFHQLDQREAEEALVELDGLLDVLADQRQVVHPADGGWRARVHRQEVALAKLVPVVPDLLKFAALWLWHVTSLFRPLGRPRRAYPAGKLPSAGRLTCSSRSPRCRLAQPRRPRLSSASADGGTAITGQQACARQYRLTRHAARRPRAPRRPAPITIRSSGLLATVTSTAPGSPRTASGSTRRSAGTWPKASSSEYSSRCHAASFQTWRR